MRGFEPPDSTASPASAQPYVFKDPETIELVTEAFQRRLRDYDVHTVWLEHSRLRAGRSAHEDFAYVVHFVVLADLRDLVALEQEVEVIAVGVFFPVARGRIRFGLDRDVGSLPDDGMEFHVQAVREHRL